MVRPALHGVKKFTITILVFVVVFVVCDNNIVWAQEQEEQTQEQTRELVPREKIAAEEFYNEHENELDFSLLYRSYIRFIIDRFYIGEKPDEKEFLYSGLKGVVRALGDRYSSFLNPSEAKVYLENSEGVFGGIGIGMVNERDSILVVDVYPDGPAERAGINRGDRIYAVDGIAISELSEPERIVKIRGPVGTTVKLSVLRPGAMRLEVVEVERQDVEIPERQVSWKVVDGVAVIKLPIFSENNANQFAAAAYEIYGHYPDVPVILDLRNNPGGLVYATQLVASIWLEAGTTLMDIKHVGGVANVTTIPYTVTSFDEEGNVTESYLLKPLFSGRKTIILVNGFSASASEVLSGALEDYGAAIVVGEKTFGKGVSQGRIEMSDGALFILTTGHWYTPNNRDIHGRGLEPYITITDDESTEKDEQLEKAIAIIKTWR